MTTEVVASATNKTSKVTYNVLIEQAESGNYLATILGWSECKAEGATKEEALTKLNQVVSARLQNAEIVSLEIDNPKTEHPWMKFAGMFQNVLKRRLKQLICRLDKLYSPHTLLIILPLVRV